MNNITFITESSAILVPKLAVSGIVTNLLPWQVLVQDGTLPATALA